MSTLENALDAVLADPLTRVAAPERAIGYVGGDVPLDLLLAATRPAMHLPWNVDRPTPFADRWLEGRFPLWARSMLEDWSAGRFDALAQVVFTRGNDVAHRLYYYVCELQRRGDLAGPEPLVFDVARVPRAASLRHTEAAIHSLAAQLSVGSAQIVAGIRQANHLRATFERLMSARSSDGPLYEKLVRASLFTDVQPLLAAHTMPVARQPRARILLAGSVPPDERLHLAVEETGASIVAELHERCALRLGSAVPEEGEPMAALARQVCSGTLGPRAFGDAGARLVAAARHARADAVVQWLSDDDEGLAWLVPAQRRALDAANLPTLTLTSRRGDCSDGAGPEIARFVTGIGS